MSDAEAYRRVQHELPSDAERLRALMTGTRWWTKSVLAARLGLSEHSISARMSDLRKLGHEVEKRYVGERVYLYRIVVEGSS